MNYVKYWASIRLNDDTINDELISLEEFINRYSETGQFAKYLLIQFKKSLLSFDEILEIFDIDNEDKCYELENF